LSDDREVTGRSDEQVRAIANQAKSELDVARIRPVNILRILRSGQIWTIYGRKKLIFNEVEDEVLGDTDGKTEFSSGTVIISIQRSVRMRAEMGVGRDRMSLAHELGHGVMHYGAPLNRKTGAAGTTELSRITPYRSAEHQAKVFASAFLIHDEIAAKLGSAEEIAVEFGVSIQAAEICFERLNKKAEHAKSADRVNKIKDEIRAKLLGVKQPEHPGYLDDPCTSCQRPTLIPIGTKVLCDTCGFVGDRFQDGDAAA